LTKEDFRVLTAIEMGMKNHELVPAPLIQAIAKLKRANTFKIINNLLKHKLILHKNTKCDGYALNYQGYDYLALRVFMKRGHITKLKQKFGVGKESDIYLCETPEGENIIVKLERLGRTSFRAVKNKRDYLKSQTSYSWFYLSRLAAIKEYAFMKALHEVSSTKNYNDIERIPDPSTN
jgi:RIO kinase 2